jgi:2'-5' RNA ligase
VRVFLALPLPEAVVNRLREVTAGLRMRTQDLKVVQPEGLHITLVFLGERSGEEVAALTPLLAAPELARGPIQASLGGYGQFPPSGSPRVVFIPLREGSRETCALQADLVAVLRGGGVLLQEENRPFSPHITLARRRSGRGGAVDYGELFAFEQRFSVDRLVLFQSVLKPQGAEYRPLQTVAFR